MNQETACSNVGATSTTPRDKITPMPLVLKILLLAIVQGLAELLPVSSSAHVVVAEKLLGLDPSSPEMTLVLVMASLGLPGLGNFVAEFMVLAGAWQVRPVVCAVASLGLIVSVIYSLVIFQRVFHEKPAEVPGVRDLSPREWTVAGLLVAGLLWLGFFPGPVWSAAGPSLSHLLTLINSFGP